MHSHSREHQFALFKSLFFRFAPTNPALHSPPGWLRYRPHDFICRLYDFRYIHRVNRLTKQELWVLCIVVGLLLTGWAVKAYRTAHPSMTGQNGLVPATQPAKL